MAAVETELLDPDGYSKVNCKLGMEVWIEIHTTYIYALGRSFYPTQLTVHSIFQCFIHFIKFEIRMQLPFVIKPIANKEGTLQDCINFQPKHDRVANTMHYQLKHIK